MYQEKKIGHYIFIFSSQLFRETLEYISSSDVQYITDLIMALESVGSIARVAKSLGAFAFAF